MKNRKNQIPLPLCVCNICIFKGVSGFKPPTESLPVIKLKMHNDTQNQWKPSKFQTPKQFLAAPLNIWMNPQTCALHFAAPQKTGFLKVSVHYITERSH